jgi:hypothetical protein
MSERNADEAREALARLGVGDKRSVYTAQDIMNVIGDPAHRQPIRYEKNQIIWETKTLRVAVSVGDDAHSISSHLLGDEETPDDRRIREALNRRTVKPEDVKRLEHILREISAVMGDPTATAPTMCIWEKSGFRVELVSEGAGEFDIQFRYKEESPEIEELFNELFRLALKLNISQQIARKAR